MEKKKLIAIIAAVVVVVLAIGAFFVLRGTKEFTVSFVSDGKVISEQTVKRGKTVERPANPEKEYYEFKGWYLENEKYDFSKKVNEDLVLDAKWERITYTITLNVDGKTSTVKTNSEGLITKPTDPVKDGYTFIGWYKDGELVDFSKPFTSDATLIARFKYNRVAVVEEIKETKPVIKVAAESNADNEKLKENTNAAVEVAKLVSDIMDGKLISGVTDELRTKIKEAVTAGKEITVEVETKEISETAIANEAKLVKATISESSKVVSYYDIVVTLKVNGEEIGTVSKLESGINLSLPIPKSVEAPKNESIDRTYTVVRVHENVATPLKTTLNEDNTVSFASDSFSVYALTYTDEVMNVKNEEEFKAALDDEDITTINIVADFETTGISITRDITINGNNKTLTGKETLDEETKYYYDAQYVLNVENKLNVTIQDINLTGAISGLSINNANVTLLGTIDVTGNNFYPIYIVAVGEDETAELNAKEAIIINKSESYNSPTIYTIGSETIEETEDGETKTIKNENITVTLKDEVTKITDTIGTGYYLYKQNVRTYNVTKEEAEYINERVEALEEPIESVGDYSKYVTISVSSLEELEQAKIKLENLNIPADAKVQIRAFTTNFSCPENAKSLDDCITFKLYKVFTLEEFNETDWATGYDILFEEDEKGYNNGYVFEIVVDQEGTYSADIGLYKEDEKLASNTVEFEIKEEVVETTEPENEETEVKEETKTEEVKEEETETTETEVTENNETTDTVEETEESSNETEEAE